MEENELPLPVDAVRPTFSSIRGHSETEYEDVLTNREREIPKYFSQGMSYAEIAETRCVKPVTLRNAIYGIQQKLDVGTMQGLVLWSVRNGLMDDLATDQHGIVRLLRLHRRPGLPPVSLPVSSSGESPE